LPEHLLDKLNFKYCAIAIVDIGQSIGRPNGQLLVDVDVEVVVRWSNVKEFLKIFSVDLVFGDFRTDGFNLCFFYWLSFQLGSHLSEDSV